MNVPWIGERGSDGSDPLLVKEDMDPNAQWVQAWQPKTPSSQGLVTGVRVLPLQKVGLVSQPCAILDSFNATLASTSEADANWLGTPDAWLDGRAPMTPRGEDADLLSTPRTGTGDLLGTPESGVSGLPSPRLQNVLESHVADWPEDTLDSLSSELPELHYPDPCAAQTACEPCTPAALDPLPGPLVPQRAVGSCDFCPAHTISPATPTQSTLLEAAVLAALRQLQPTPGGHLAAEALGLLEWLAQSRQQARAQTQMSTDGAEQFFTPQAGSDAGESPGPSCYGTPLPVFELLEPPSPAGLAGEDAAITPLMRAIELCDESDFLTAPAAENEW